MFTGLKSQYRAILLDYILHPSIFWLALVGVHVLIQQRMSSFGSLFYPRPSGSRRRIVHPDQHGRSLYRLKPSFLLVPLNIHVNLLRSDEVVSADDGF